MAYYGRIWYGMTPCISAGSRHFGKEGRGTGSFEKYGQQHASVLQMQFFRVFFFLIKYLHNYQRKGVGGGGEGGGFGPVPEIRPRVARPVKYGIIG